MFKEDTHPAGTLGIKMFMDAATCTSDLIVVLSEPLGQTSTKSID